MNREYHKWYSERLRRDMELLIFGHAGAAVLFFPTRMARFYDYENWRIIEAIKDRINNGELQIFCVDSVDAESFYNQAVHPEERILRHTQYDQYIVNEVIPLMQQINGGNYFEVAGCSMGAFHAVNLALRHPWLFNKCVCMSGRYDLTEQIQDFSDLFDGFRSDNIYFNTPMQYVANMHDDHLLNLIRHMEIIFAIGETDPFLPNNHEFSQLLWSKGIPNNLFIWEHYAHRPRSWRQMVQIYF
jgi:esterase/lipase superfamily enzyme